MSEERESESSRRPDRSAGRPDPELAPVPVAVAVLAAVLALLLAGCESDDDSTTEARLSTEPKPAEVSRAAVLVAQAGNGWAPLFAKNYLWACKYVYPPAWVGPDSHGQQPTPPLPAARRFARRLCAGFGLDSRSGRPSAEAERAHGGPGPHDRPPSGFQKSFADATVESVAVKGDKAWAEFSNGKLVEFIRVAQAELPIGVTPGWYIYHLGGDAGKKYFEP
jgi:hypothetical protein